MNASNQGWLRARIEANQRHAKVTECACGAVIVAGLDDDMCALTANADPYPLTRRGEVLLRAVTTRRSYVLIGKALYRRTDLGPTDHPTLAQHTCGQPLPDAWLADLPPPLTAYLPDMPPY